MKKLILIIFAALLFSGCTQGLQVTFDDDNSNAIRGHFQNYLNNDMDGLKELWSPSSKCWTHGKKSLVHT